MAANDKRKRKWVYGFNTIFSSIVFLAILVVVILIAERNPWRVDLTESQSFSLSEQTGNILKGIDRPLAIKCFYSTAAPDQMQGKDKTKDLLDTYRYHSRNISYEFIDPDLQPEVARRYDVKTYGTLVIEGYDKKQVVQTPSEENITSAILKLSRKEQKKIYFLTGHGENSFTGPERESYSAARTALEKNYYQVAEFNLLQQPDVPADAAAVVVAGPRKPIPDREREVLKAYLERGGKLFVMVDPLTATGLEDFLKGFGVQVGNDVVVDKLSRLFGASEQVPVVIEYGRHKIASNFNLPTFFPDARSVVPAKEPGEGVQVQTLASTSPNAWAERNIEMLKGGEAAFDEAADMPGPVPLVVVVDVSSRKKDQAPDAPRDGVLVVAGDSDFASNPYFGLYGNGDFFLNTINYLADEADLITAKPRRDPSSPVLLTRGQASAMFWIVLVLVPLAVLVSGALVYRARRSQR